MTGPKISEISKEAIDSTVRIDILSEDRIIRGTGVIIDDNSILTAAHVLTPLMDDTNARVRIMFSQSLSKLPVVVQGDDIVVQILKDPDPDRDGQTTLNYIPEDLGVLGSTEFDFQSFWHPALSTATTIDTVFRPRILDVGGVGYIQHEVSSGLTLTAGEGILRLSHTSIPGDSGSGLFSSRAGAFGLVGVVSTEIYAAALTDQTIEQVLHLATLDDNTPIDTAGTKGDDTYETFYHAGISMIFGMARTEIPHTMDSTLNSPSSVITAILDFRPLQFDTLVEKHLLIQRMIDHLGIEFESAEAQYAAEQWAHGIEVNDLVLIGLDALQDQLNGLHSP
jgi:hypothetical protein